MNHLVLDTKAVPIAFMQIMTGFPVEVLREIYVSMLGYSERKGYFIAKVDPEMHSWLSGEKVCRLGKYGFVSLRLNNYDKTSGWGVSGWEKTLDIEYMSKNDLFDMNMWSNDPRYMSDGAPLSDDAIMELEADPKSCENMWYIIKRSQLNIRGKRFKVWSYYSIREATDGRWEFPECTNFATLMQA